MCIPTAVVAAIGVAGSLMSGYSQYKQGKASAQASEYQASIYRNNAVIANQNAINERQQGIEDARKIRIKTLSNIANQKAAMAANGADINDGTPVDLTAGTAEIGELDALNAISNANKRSDVYKQQSNDFYNQSNLSLLSAKNAKTSGLLTGIGTGLSGLSQVSGKWYDYKAKTKQGAL